MVYCYVIPCVQNGPLICIDLHIWFKLRVPYFQICREKICFNPGPILEAILRIIYTYSTIIRRNLHHVRIQRYEVLLHLIVITLNYIGYIPST